MFIMWYLDVNKRRHGEQGKSLGWDTAKPETEAQIGGKTIATWSRTAG